MSESADTYYLRYLYEQFSNAIDAGVESFEYPIPVVSLASNRITLGANAKKLPSALHTITLRKHPSQTIRVSLESAFGLACPDPLPSTGLVVHELPPDVAVAPETTARYMGIVICSKPDFLSVTGATFDGEFAHLNGVDRRDQRFLAAQVAGVATLQSLRPFADA